MAQTAQNPTPTAEEQALAAARKVIADAAKAKREAMKLVPKPIKTPEQLLQEAREDEKKAADAATAKRIAREQQERLQATIDSYKPLFDDVREIKTEIENKERAVQGDTGLAKQALWPALQRIAARAVADKLAPPSVKLIGEIHLGKFSKIASSTVKSYLSTMLRSVEVFSNPAKIAQAKDAKVAVPASLDEAASYGAMRDVLAVVPSESGKNADPLKASVNAAMQRLQDAVKDALKLKGEDRKAAAELVMASLAKATGEIRTLVPEQAAVDDAPEATKAVAAVLDPITSGWVDDGDEFDANAEQDAEDAAILAQHNADVGNEDGERDVA